MGLVTRLHVGLRFQVQLKDGEWSRIFIVWHLTADRVLFHDGSREERTRRLKRVEFNRLRRINRIRYVRQV